MIEKKIRGAYNKGDSAAFGGKERKTMNRKLYRSYSNRMLCGVCGGIGEFFHIDPTIVRLVWVLLSIPGPGIIAYLLASIIIPTEN